jgi:hypothetical protein
MGNFGVAGFGRRVPTVAAIYFDHAAGLKPRFAFPLEPWGNLAQVM